MADDLVNTCCVALDSSYARIHLFVVLLSGNFKRFGLAADLVNTCCVDLDLFYALIHLFLVILSGNFKRFGLVADLATQIGRSSRYTSQAALRHTFLTFGP